MQEVSEQQKYSFGPRDGTFRTYAPLLHSCFKEDGYDLSKVYLSRNKASTKWRSAVPVGRKKKPTAVAAAAAAATSKTPPMSQPTDEKAEEPTAMDEDDNAALNNDGAGEAKAEPETKKEPDTLDGDKTRVRFKYAEQMRLPLAPAGRRGLPGQVVVPPAQKSSVVGSTDYLFALKGRGNSKATTKSKQANEACWSMLQEKMEKNKAADDEAEEKEAAEVAPAAEEAAPEDPAAEAPPAAPETTE